MVIVIVIFQEYISSVDKCKYFIKVKTQQKESLIF